ncbi:hypothetical protein KIN20_000143 [Parelaphostrongylus tenuis]|uniref:Uncharacterized protein n=1 Tax=Parelaphostrongylus tenuis TaxID=148309 RepID=A0AAD5QDK5_PARTN|nr:hypothetical protein KIN20_000143 [Parelaphostrongylus tenuis]
MANLAETKNTEKSANNTTEVAIYIYSYTATTDDMQIYVDIGQLQRYFKHFIGYIKH